MSKIILTKKQAEFIEGFKKKYYSDNEETVEVAEILPTWASCALRNLTQFGFGKGLEDGNGKKVSDENNYENGDFRHDQVPLLIEAIMHGYEVEKDKNVFLYIEFSENGMGERRKLYYGTSINVTSRDSASKFDLNLNLDKKQVKKLEAQGWEVEEVE